MKKWRVYAVVHGSKYVGTFEARSAKDAEEKAWKSSGAYVSLCHQCSSECEDPECTEMSVEEAEDNAEVDNGEEER